jgi:hypothetical protein
MPTQAWGQLLDGNFDIANGTTNTTGAEAIVMPDKTIPAFYMTEGRAIRATVRFKFSNVITTPGSVTFRVRWGGVAGTLLAQTSAIALNATAQTDIMGVLICDIVCRGRGGSGSLLAMGKVELAQELAASNNASNFMGSAGGATTNTPAAVTVTTIVDTLLSITYQSTVATGSMTGMIYTLELLN